MAYSTQRAVSDGTLQLLMIAIEFFDKSEISVYFNNIPTTAFTWATDKSLHFNSVVPNGVEVLIRRTTDLSGVRHVFSLGAQFKDSTLDDDFKQILHIAQEAVEGANVGDIYSTLNMHGNSIVNVGPAVADGDAISLGQVRTESQGAYLANTQAQAAAASASAASAIAVTQGGIATTAATTATAQAGIATTQAGISTTQAGLSSTARTGAEAAQAAAAASSTLAQKWAAELENVVVSGGLYSSFHYSRKSAQSATDSAASAAAAASSAASVNLPSISGKPGQYLRINSGATALEYVAVPKQALFTAKVGTPGTYGPAAALPFGTTVLNIGGFTKAASNTQIVVPVTGNYRVRYHANHGSATQMEVRLAKSATAVSRAQALDWSLAGYSGFMTLVMEGTYALVAGDYILVYIWLGTVTDSATDPNGWLSIELIDPFPV